MEAALKKARLNTNFGAIEIELDSEKAPLTVENFISYIKSGHYNGTVFHRVIDNFMIQGGGLDAQLTEKPTHAAIKNEANNGLTNNKYSIAMARTMAPHSATSQFFINVADNDFLNFKAENNSGWGYAVFGRVSAGTDVVDKIKASKTKSVSGYDDVPVETVIIETASIIEE
ncbi:MAG: peptidyl-prolyl cis-trans isomerase [Burkholderiales bacterium]|nr:peptidyl-prolyl cis-trans isomerase [Burkholderiales bacterium]